VWPKDYDSFSRVLIGVLFIGYLMISERLFQGSTIKIGLSVLFWISSSVIMLSPKSWWTRKRIWMATFVIALETAIGFVLYQETRLLYFFAVVILALSFRLSMSKTSLPAIVALFVTAALYMRFGHGDLFSLLSFVLLAAALYITVRNRIQRNQMFEENKRHLIELQEAYDQLQEASSTAMQYAVLEERARIARDIHDAVGHSLTSLIVQMQALRYMMANDPMQAGRSLDVMLEVARQGLQDIRASVHSLAEDRSSSGITSFKALLSRMEATASIRSTFHAQVTDDELDSEMNGIFFRVLQEAITNVIRHSGASEVEVGLSKEKGFIVMRIRDNGKLSSDQTVDVGFGLKEMRARLESRGGRLGCASVEPHGFELLAAIPDGEEATHRSVDQEG
jgi:signal transduction histidine kinase